MDKLKQIIWPLSIIIAAAIFSWSLYLIANNSALAMFLRGVSLSGTKIGKILLPVEVTESFHSYIQSHSQSQKLVLVSETRIVSNTKTLRSGPSTAELEISAPVEYNYYVDLTGDWKLSIDNSILRIQAPKLKTMTPAVSLSGIRETIKSGWLVFGENEAMQEFKKNFESNLKKQAMTDLGHKNQIYDSARLSLAKIISTWIDGGMFKEYPVREIAVSFEGESETPSFNITVNNNGKRQ